MERIRLWVGRPVPGEEGAYDLRPVEAGYSLKQLRRLNRFPLLLSLKLSVLFSAAAVILAHVPGEVGAGLALWVMIAGAVVSAAVFVRQLRLRVSMRRTPEKFYKRAYLAYDAAEGEEVFTEAELKEVNPARSPATRE
ncbi:hypothetical protein KAU45_03010 [bacterium]|nr:hypothetical protein [bacterium]